MTQGREPTDEEMDALVAAALTAKGELIPTSVDEVRAAEEAGVDYEGELPGSLREAPELSPVSRVGKTVAEAPEQAASQRVVSLEEVRRARAARTSSPFAFAATFLAGAAVAAGVALVVRPSGPMPVSPEQGAGPVPSASTSASSQQEDNVVIESARSCGQGCCAGSACADAKGELAACASGRSCIACDAPTSGSAYQVRLASLVPTDVLKEVPLESLDLCGRVLGGEWSCLPAYAAPAATPAPRTLAKPVTTADLAYGLEVELRPRGTKTVLGRWRDSVRLGPTVLCRGLGALVTNDKSENVGSLAVTLEDPYRVEIARAADVGALKALRARIAFADVEPFVVETTAAGDRHFALAAGPFDQVTAEKLRWMLVERSVGAKTVLGEDYTGAPLRLP